MAASPELMHGVNYIYCKRSEYTPTGIYYIIMSNDGIMMMSGVCSWIYPEHVTR